MNVPSNAILRRVLFDLHLIMCLSISPRSVSGEMNAVKSGFMCFEVRTHNAHSCLACHQGRHCMSDKLWVTFDNTSLSGGGDAKSWQETGSPCAIISLRYSISIREGFARFHWQFIGGKCVLTCSVVPSDARAAGRRPLRLAVRGACVWTECESERAVVERVRR